MSTSSVFAVAGGGLAGARAVEALRDKGFDGRIVVFAAEHHYPYDRIPLSKEFLAAKTSPIARGYDEADKRLTLPDFTVHDADWYRDHDVDLRLGVEVTALDPSGHTVTLDDGGAVTTAHYDKLLLTTGARARRPAIPGIDAQRVHCLRTVDDAAALDAALADGSSLAVLGAGWIGLEVAASARQRGVPVTVVGRSRLPLLSALGEEVGEVFARLHRDNGVDLRLSAHVTEITTAGGQATGLRLTDGTRVAADTVLVAIGAQPNVELAGQAGLAIGEGILVDASLRTSDPDVYAAGDVATVQNPLLNKRIRTGHWADARKQPSVAATGMLGGAAEYAELPYFFTDQYDLGMEYAGHAPEYRRVVFRGDVEAREFIAFWLDDHDRVLAGMSVNVWDVIADVKNVIRAGIRVDPGRLADPHRPLRDLTAN